jgi:hypothetical protein
MMFSRPWLRTNAVSYGENGHTSSPLAFIVSIITVIPVFRKKLQ